MVCGHATHTDELRVSNRSVVALLVAAAYFLYMNATGGDAPAAENARMR